MAAGNSSPSSTPQKIYADVVSFFWKLNVWNTCREARHNSSSFHFISSGFFNTFSSIFGLGEEELSSFFYGEKRNGSSEGNENEHFTPQFPFRVKRGGRRRLLLLASKGGNKFPDTKEKKRGRGGEMSQKFDIHLVYKIFLYRISLISRDSQTFGIVQKCLKMPLFISHKQISFLKPFSSLFFVARRHSGRDRAKKVNREKTLKKTHFGSQEIPPSQNRNSGVCSWHYVSWIHSKKGITYPGQGGRIPTKGKNRALSMRREEGNNHWNGNIKKRKGKKECGERDWKATGGAKISGSAFLRAVLSSVSSIRLWGKEDFFANQGRDLPKVTLEKR